MSKIYLFLPDFKSLVKGTLFTTESLGFNHATFYYEDDEWIYFYKPIGSFVYCYQSVKARMDGEIELQGLSEEEIKDLKQEFKAIEVPNMLYVSSITTTTTGVIKT